MRPHLSVVDRAPSLRGAIARNLEEGAWNGPLSRAASVAWDALASQSIVRPLTWPDGVRVVAVGGATLGGSGRTPLAIACARALSEAGARVAFVAHAYGARPDTARRVHADDDVSLVGDEALVAARALEGYASVVTGPTRQRALDKAARMADVVVLDGVNQTAPRRASLALLALDRSRPWGSLGLPPCGDLRASRTVLLSACDHAVGLEPGPSRGAFHAGALLRWPELARMRVGLFLALARPERILTHLAHHGVVPAETVAIPDHGPLPRAVAARIAASPVELWLATAKCGTHLEPARIPHAVLEHEVSLNWPVASALRRLA